MNRESFKSDHQQRLWTRPLQVPSRSGNDAQETAILSSIHSLDRNRLKRTRASVAVVPASSPAPVGDLPEEHQARPLPPSLAFNNNNNNITTNNNTATMEPLELKPVFQLQSLSLDRGAIAPGLARPTAPFAKSARKKAYVSAIYYSECFLKNIQPREADQAAFEIQNQYTKWWVQSKKQSSSSSSSSKSSSGSSRNSSSRNSSKRKRRRLEAETLLSEERDDDQKQPPPSSMTPWDPEVVNLLKERMIEHLQKTGGDTTTTEFKRCLEQLQAAFVSQQQHSSAADTVANTDGTWLTLSKPTFSECQGRNEDGEFLYTLGRMSFDMFRPTHLRCSIRAIMNNIRVMDPNTKPQSFPSRLNKQLRDHHNNTDNPIRHYDIVVAFTIQPNQTRRGTVPSANYAQQEFVVPRPIRGLMTNHGYMVADPKTPNRSTIWFSGGSIEVQDEIDDAEIWKQIFDESLVPRRDPKAIANLLAAKLLLGAHTTTTNANQDNQQLNNNNNSAEDSVPTMSYFFKRPIGGHGEVYCDVLYADETLRITQGHHGSIFVATRVPIFQEPTSSSSSQGEEQEG